MTMPTAVKRQEVQRAIAAALTDAGYQKIPRAQSSFRKPLTTDVSGWVSYFSQRMPSGEIEVTPTVGVRHERMHELIDRLEERHSGSSEPTDAIILGYLMPQQTANLVWRFDLETPMDDQAQNLVEHVMRYGEPWMREHASAETIIEDMRADRRLHPARLPVALLLAGRAEEAREALDALLNEAGDRSDEVADDFRRFAERFRLEALSSADGSADDVEGD